MLPQYPQQHPQHVAIAAAPWHPTAAFSNTFHVSSSCTGYMTCAAGLRMQHDTGNVRKNNGYPAITKHHRPIFAIRDLCWLAPCAS